jgi:hypothetical protein
MHERRKIPHLISCRPHSCDDFLRLLYALQVPCGQRVDFPQRDEGTNKAVSSCAWLQIQGRKLLESIINAHTSSNSVQKRSSQTTASCMQRDTTGQTPEDDIKLRFNMLSDYLGRCSSSIFYELQGRLRTDMSFRSSVGSGIPNEVKNESELKVVIAQGLRGATGWSLKARLAVVRMLLDYDSTILLAQIGALSEVHSGYATCCLSH